MNRFKFDGVEAEKAIAMKRYRRRRSFLNVLRAAEVTAAVALLGHWWLPIAAILLETAGDWCRRIGAFLNSSLAILVIVNLLIIWIVALSGRSTENQPDLYDQYISASTASGGEAGGVDPAPEESDYFQDKHILPASQQQQIEPVEERSRTLKASAAEPDQKVCCEAVTTVEEVKIYKRTQSERRPGQPRQRVEYRRSETATVHRVEGLSNEDFQKEIETFIKAKKRMLRQENDVVQWQGQPAGDQSPSCLFRTRGA